ncbi:unnamed protein product [Ilex paraguariensis]|uniref:Pentatricopeptide repeat-containing protein n=1 Tax=Ilex paraguariensis TaxID=185542 RepID=A0ABC8RBN7_9AQUA
MTKLIFSFHTHFRLFVIPKTHLRFRTITSKPTHQHDLQLPEIDRTIDSIRSISSNPYFSLLVLCKNIYSLKKIHALFIVHGLTNDLLCQTKLVGLYGLYGHIGNARLVFDQIQNPDFFTCKVMIRWYFMNDLYSEVVEFCNRMKKCLREYDNVVSSIVLKACSELRDIDEGKSVHCQIIKVGSPDSIVLTGLMDMYAKCGDVESSRQVFDGIRDRNVICWTSMIVGFVQNDCAEEGLVLFNRMRDGLVQGNEYTFGSVVTACTKLGALHQGKWVHGYVIKNGIDVNSHLVTALLDMYVKCGAIRDARSIFDELCSIDLVSWTAMIVGYTQNGHPDEALKLFTDQEWAGFFPNSITITSVLSACAQLGNLKFGKSVQCLGIKLGLEDASITNALIDIYSKCHMIGDARYLFDTVSEMDVIAWNSIISGYSLNGSAYEALTLFHRMTEYLWPDSTTLVNVLSACTSLDALQFGSSLHAYAIKGGLSSCNVYVGTSLLNFYAKCGDVQSARKVFDGMGEKNTITWNAMIGGYGMQGDCSGSLELFNEMMKEELEPNDATFIAILSACSHTGMVSEGWKNFDSMCREYNFIPSVKHYVCIVDLLARASRLEEALDFMEAMPIQADVSVYGAFLHGCSLHSRFDLGEVAIRRMIGLHPDDASYYVRIAQLYASDGRWNQVYQVRELMKRSGLRKLAAYSQVEMDIEGFHPTYRVSSGGNLHQTDAGKLPFDMSWITLAKVGLGCFEMSWQT